MKISKADDEAQVPLFSDFKFMYHIKHFWGTNNIVKNTTFADPHTHVITNPFIYTKSAIHDQ